MQVALQIDNLRSFLLKRLQQFGKLDFSLPDRHLLCAFIIHFLVFLFHYLLLAKLFVDALELLFLVANQCLSFGELSLQGFLLKFLLDNASFKIVDFDILGQTLFFSLSERRIIVILLAEFVNS